MNFGEMRSSVRQKLCELSANFWTDQDIDDSLNEALEEISDATEWYERMTTIALWSGRSYLDVRELLSDTFLAPKRCRNNQTGKWMIPADVRDQGQSYVQWEKVKTEPEQFFIRGLWWLGFFPCPSSDNGSVTLYFSALPPVMEDDSDEPEFPREFHLGIVSYAVYDLLCQDVETEKAILWWNEYFSHEQKLRSYVQQRTSTDGVEQYRG